MVKKKQFDKQPKLLTARKSSNIQWPNATPLFEPPDEDRDRIVDEDFSNGPPAYKTPLKEKERKKL